MPSSSLAPLWTRDFVLLTVAHFLQALGYATLILLPLYLAHLGASRTQIGTIMSTAAMGGLLFRPLVGWSLDVFGRRPTLAVGTVVLVVAMWLVGAVESLGPLIYVHRVLVGIGGGALFTGYFAFAADMIPSSRRTEGIALFGISGLLPIAVNPFVESLGIEPVQLRWFLPMIGVLIAMSLPLLWVVKEPVRATPVAQEGTRAKVSFTEVSRALRRRPLWSVWIATAVFAGMVALFMAFATVAASASGAESPASLWLTYAFGAVSVRLFGARLPDRVGPANLVAPALASYSAAMLLCAWAPSGLAFVMAGFLAGLGHGYCFPVLTSQVVSRAPEHLRGSALSMFTALWSAASLCMTPAFGLVADLWDDRTMFALAAVVAVVGLSLWAFFEHGAEEAV